MQWMRLNLLIIQLKEYWTVENPCFLDGHKKELNSSILQSNYLKREHLDIIIDFINRLLKKKVLQYSNQNQFKKIAFLLKSLNKK